MEGKSVVKTSSSTIEDSAETKQKEEGANKFLPLDKAQLMKQIRLKTTNGHQATKRVRGLPYLKGNTIF